ncbi:MULTISPECIES: hypothetical protein [unclassified Mesorhizobium]|uniref:hypothetical protein n=1 Tax=unclassified Mesorhizobium TaxID=325217 RepID=UPI0016739B77|nr:MULTISPECIES: hypothetical protein [unclassified Mesorhizobium]
MRWIVKLFGFSGTSSQFPLVTQQLIIWLEGAEIADTEHCEPNTDGKGRARIRTDGFARALAGIQAHQG